MTFRYIHEQRDRYRSYTDPQVVMIKDDELGKERFKAFEDQLKNFELSPEHKKQHDRIATVFYYRLQIAEQAKFPWTYPDASRRLEGFKPVKFFLDAMEVLVAAVKKEAADKGSAKAIKKAKPRVRSYY